MLQVTVVTPCFNMGKYLNSTIRSVLDNLEPGDEYFIIDGGSTDNSVKIIEAYSDKLTGWISEKDHGYADALAKGFKRGTGDIYCWINASDLLLPGALNKAREVLTDAGPDFIFGDDFYISENDRIISYSKGWVRNLRSAMLYGGWTPLQDACFWKKELYEKVGGINTTLKYAADFDLFLHFAMAGKSQYVPYIFSAFRKHDDQKSIANITGYTQERKDTIKNTLMLCNQAWLKTFFLKLYYWIYVRLRARVFHPLWDKKKYRGLSIGTIFSKQEKNNVVQNFNSD